MKKLLTAGKNTSVIPLTTPGKESGKVTRKNVCLSFAPKSCEATSRFGSILEIAVKSVKS